MTLLCCHKHFSLLKGTNCPEVDADIWHLNNDRATGPSWPLSWKMLPFKRDNSGFEIFLQERAAVYSWRRCSLEMSRISGKCWKALQSWNVCFVNEMRFLTPSWSPNLSGAIRPLNVSLWVGTHTQTHAHTQTHFGQDVHLAWRWSLISCNFWTSLFLGLQPPAMGLFIIHYPKHTHIHIRAHTSIHPSIYLSLSLSKLQLQPFHCT